METHEYLLILLGGVFVNNFALTQFLGLCPFIGVSRQMDTAIGMSFATTLVLTLSAGLSYLVYEFILIPFELVFLRTLVFIFLIAATVQATELLLRALSPVLHKVLGIFLPLITSNCAVLGVALFATQSELPSLGAALFYGASAGLGFSLALILLSSIRVRIAQADIPNPFQGPGIALLTAGIMSLAFMGFVGMDQ